MDAREAPFLETCPRSSSGAPRRGAGQLIFLECANDVLVKRYRETRRVHPLAPEGTVEEGIERERSLLDRRRLADHVIDTSA